MTGLTSDIVIISAIDKFYDSNVAVIFVTGLWKTYLFGTSIGLI